MPQAMCRSAARKCWSPPWNGAAGSPTSSGVQAWRSALEPYVDKGPTFRAYRAAIGWHLLQRIRSVLGQQDKIQRAFGPCEAWKALCDELSGLCDELVSVAEISREPYKASGQLGSKPGKAKPSKSKKPVPGLLDKKYSNWRVEILRAFQGSPYLDAVLVMMCIGCRPIELLWGVEVSLAADGQHFCLSVQKGGKVTQTAGQPYRRLTLPLSKMPVEWHKRAKEGSAFMVKIDDRDKLRNAMQRVSRRVFPGVPCVTAYALRHALATDVRDDGFSAEQIALILGHTAASTQAYYGRRSGGGRKPQVRAKIEMRVEAPRAVRPLDRSGLEAVVRGKRQAARGKKVR